MTNQSLPPLPDGATLDHPADWLPPLPPGATLDATGQSFGASAKPEPYDSDKGPYKDLPVWLRPDNAFMRFSRMAEHGATAGLSSEVKPVADLAVQGVREKSLAKGAEAYHQAKQQEAQRVQQGREEFGIAPELIGGMGSVRSMPGVAAPAIAPTLGERIGSSAKIGAGFGAVSGATEGDGTLGERLGNAAISGATGAVVGPVLSEAVVPAAGYVAQTLMPGDRVGRAVRGMIPGMKENIDRKLFDTLRQDGLSPDEAIAALQKVRDAAKFNSTQLDPYYTLADIGPATQQLLYSAKSTSGPAKAYTENFLDARAKGADKVPAYAQSNPNGPNMPGQHERVTDYTQRALQATTQKNAAKVEDKLKATQKAAKDPAYDAFYKYNGTIPVEDILQAHAADIASKTTTGSKLAKNIDSAYEPFMDEPHGIGVTQMPSLTEQAQYNLAMRRLNNAIQKAQDAGDQGLANDLMMKRAGLTQQFQAKTHPTNLTQLTYDLTPEKFDVAKKQLDGKIRAALKDPERQYEASLLLDLKHALVRRADETTAIIDPATGLPQVDKNGDPMSLYRNAREAYAEPQDLLDALEAGRNFKNEDVDRIKETLKGYTSKEKAKYRAGAATDIRQDLGDKPRGANVAGYFNKPNMETRMQAMAGPKRAEQHEKLMDIENQMADTRAKVNKGSRTEENREANQEMNMWSRAGQKLLAAKPIAATLDVISTSIAHLYRYRKTDAMQIARALLETDPVRQEAVLNRIKARYGQQSVTAAMNHAKMLANRAMGVGAAGPAADYASGAHDHSSRLDQIETGPHSPEEKRNLRRQVFEDALRNT